MMLFLSRDKKSTNEIRQGHRTSRYSVTMLAHPWFIQTVMPHCLHHSFEYMLEVSRCVWSKDFCLKNLPSFSQQPCDAGPHILLSLQLRKKLERQGKPIIQWHSGQTAPHP
jgi:hypothetical protein